MAKSRLNKVAKALRHRSTPAERKLWYALQQVMRVRLVKFRRQQPIDKYVVDFFCPAPRLVVEIDGSSHDAKREQDEVREKYLKAQGLRIVRFTEQETLRHCEAVIERILSEIES